MTAIYADFRDLRPVDGAWFDEETDSAVSYETFLEQARLLDGS